MTSGRAFFSSNAAGTGGQGRVHRDLFPVAGFVNEVGGDRVSP